MSTTLTPDQVRRALAQRVVDIAALKEAASVRGPANAPAQVQNASFSILPGGSVPVAPQRVQSGGTLQVTQTWVVRCVHRTNPRGKADVLDEQHRDVRKVRDALLTYRADELQTVQNTITWVRTTEPLSLGDGSYQVDVVCTVTYREAIGDAASVPAAVDVTA
jgi:hypothetical protein